MSELEKQLSAYYIESDEDEVSDDDNLQEDFNNRFYKDFNFDTFQENAELQKMIMMQENEKIYKRIEAILKVAMYDKKYLHSDEIKVDKEKYQHLQKKMNLQSFKRSEQSLVKPLSYRLEQIQQLLKPGSPGMLDVVEKANTRK